MSGLIDNVAGLFFGEGLEFIEGLGSPLGLDIILVLPGQLYWGDEALFWGTDALLWGS